jgi:hypothetical protein
VSRRGGVLQVPEVLTPSTACFEDRNVHFEKLGLFQNTFFCNLAAAAAVLSAAPVGCAGEIPAAPARWGGDNLKTDPGPSGRA